MTTHSRGSRIRIFISYRHNDADYPAGWLFDRLVGHYGSAQVFKDVNSIELGEDFAAQIRDAVGSCAVLLAVIGRQWLTAAGPDGRVRLDDPDDFVRLEIEAALARGTQVIPVLVYGAPVPQAGQLPVALRPLASRQALELSAKAFGSDFGRLLAALENVANLSPADAPVPNFAGSVSVYLPVVALFRIFSRDSFVRMNSVQALAIYLLYAATIVCNVLSVPHAPSRTPPVFSQPWLGLLIAATVVGYCVATTLLFYCIIQLSRQRLPKIFILTRATAFVAGHARHAKPMPTSRKRGSRI